MNDVLYITRGLLPVVLGNTLIPLEAEDETLLAGETDGLAIDWTATSDFALSTWAMQAVQERNSSVDTLQSPHVFFTQSGTSPKYVKASSTTIGWSPHNLIIQSQEIDNAAWAKTNATATANSTTAPDGTSTADTLTEDGSNTTHSFQLADVSAATIVAGVVYTASIYVKANGRTKGSLYIGESSTLSNHAGISFDLSAVSTAQVTPNTWSHVARSITDVGSGWYRISVTVQTVGQTTCVLLLRLRDGANAETYTGDSASGMFAWGAQLDRGTTGPTAYIATTAAAKIGLPISYGEGLLVEPAATNLILRSQEFENAAWTNNASSESANTTTAPDGSTTADTLIENNTSAEHHIVNTTGITIASGATTTFSVFAKAKERTRVDIAAYDNVANACRGGFDLSGGQIGYAAYESFGTAFSNVSSSIEAIGSGWYRCKLTYTNSTNTTHNFFIALDSGSGTGAQSTTYAGDNASGAYIWGAQLETGTVATSYIPTVAASATRAKDVISVPVSAFGYSQTVGTVYTDQNLVAPTALYNAVWQFDAGTDNDKIGGFWDKDNDRFQLDSVDGGAAQCSISQGDAAARNQATYSWQANNFALSVDGASPVTDTSGTVEGAVTTLLLGSNSSPATYNWRHRRFIYVPRRVIDGDLPTWRYTA